VFGALVIVITIFARHGLTYYLAQGERHLFAVLVDSGARNRAIAALRGSAWRHRRRPPVAAAPELSNEQSLRETILENTLPPDGWPHPASTSAPPIGEVLLEVRDVSKAFGGVHASRNLTFDVRQGEILGVIGPNGAGKTTVFNLISGFMRPDAGRISWLGTDVTKVSANRRARMGLVRTFQQPRTFAALTVRQNLVIAAQSRPITVAHAARRGDATSVDAIIDMFEFGSSADTVASDLSYGYAKRLGVAMAVATNPMLVLLDEPAAGLNSQDIQQLCDDLVTLRAAGASICVVEHHMDLVMEICDRVIVLDVGELIASGSPDEIMNHPQVIEAYLGAPA
jgi:branched-chain amino acid transport system ATP-binding protein